MIVYLEMSATMGALSGAFSGAFFYNIGGFIMPILVLAISLIFSLALACLFFENDTEDGNIEEDDIDFKMLTSSK